MPPSDPVRHLIFSRNTRRGSSSRGRGTGLLARNGDAAKAEFVLVAFDAGLTVAATGARPVSGVTDDAFYIATTGTLQFIKGKRGSDSGGLAIHGGGPAQAEPDEADTITLACTIAADL
jgi:hypothetical protein